jgi:hypothetical protein
MLDLVPAEATHVLWHESDLLTGTDLVERLAAPQKAVVGGWPTLGHEDLRLLMPIKMTFETCAFYDSYAYRKDGVRFKNNPPYNSCYRPDEVFSLDSVGSVMLVQADYIRRGARMGVGGVVGLCDVIREMGGEVFCDPRVPVSQPLELWVFNDD